MFVYLNSNEKAFRENGNIMLYFEDHFSAKTHNKREREKKREGRVQIMLKQIFKPLQCQGLISPTFFCSVYTSRFREYCAEQKPWGWATTLVWLIAKVIS